MSKEHEGGLYFHSLNNLEREGRSTRGQLFNRSFWLNRVPRLMLLCRLLGHVPVVNGHSSRWVCCDRCGVRPNPQGSLDPARWSIGQPYNNEFTAEPPEWLTQPTRSRLGEPGPVFPEHYPPGPWPERPTGTVGGQLVLGKTFGVFSVQVTIGSAGSEHTLAGHVSINPLGALYLHTEGFGTWVQRRLIPTGYDDRVIGLSVHDGRVRWSLWEREGHWSSEQPKWWEGSFRCDPRDLLLGPLKWERENIGGPVPVVVRMPYSDEDTYKVELQLQQAQRRRKRGRPGEPEWWVDWRSKKGIPVRRHDWKGNEVLGSTVRVTRQDVTSGLWPMVAAAKIAEHMMESRVHHGYTPLHLEDDVEPAMDLG
ncbi:hypothetical protein [Saccharothrix xinjiangensis]|uniref:Uncharacterized protein n=1 Tax=Saccharothrix xinjiangensis TaxID=204798 RepID=A0ABV9XTI5_9PSEU